MADTRRMADEVRSVEVHLYAAARTAAQGQELLAVAPGSLEAILSAAVAQCPGLGAVLPRCSTLIDGVVAHDSGQHVNAGSRVDVLPPFAGG